MDEMTYEGALAHVALAEVLQWLHKVRATVRFMDDGGETVLRVAVHTDPSSPQRIDVALVPVEEGSTTSLALSLRAAQGVIEPQIRRATLRAVPSV